MVETPGVMRGASPAPAPDAAEATEEGQLRHDDESGEDTEEKDRERPPDAAPAPVAPLSWAWPRELPGGAERAAYAELKAKAMDGLGERGRQAMLEGRLAPEVVGEASAGELRKCLMDRAVKVVPLLQRLQAEARAVRVARERDQVDDATLGAFDAVDGAMKREIDEVKGEAEWLSDQTGQRRGMGEQIWPMAFQVYAQRRAEVARRAESAKAS